MSSKILHVLYSGLGGHGSVFFSIVQADEAKRYEYEALFAGVEPVRDEYIGKCNSLGVKWNHARKNKLIDLAYYRNVYKIIKRSSPDIVFLHGSSLIVPTWIYNAITRKNVIIIVIDHQANHLKTTKGWIDLFFSLVLANHVVFLTETFRKEIRRRFGAFICDRKSTVIPSGIDLSLFRVAADNRNEEVIKIGMQSRLVPIKDHQTLLYSFKLLKDRIPDRNIQLLIAGDGDMAPELKRLASELNIQDDVYFLGMLNEPALIDFLNQLDIYVHATYGETLSTAILQAMAVKLPIVASDVDGINNMLKNGETALLVPLKNADDLCNAIIFLLSNPDFRNKISLNAHKICREKYSSKTMFNSYLELLRKIR